MLFRASWHPKSTTYRKAIAFTGRSVIVGTYGRDNNFRISGGGCYDDIVICDIVTGSSGKISLVCYWSSLGHRKGSFDLRPVSHCPHCISSGRIGLSGIADSYYCRTGDVVKTVVYLEPLGRVAAGWDSGSPLSIKRSKV